MTARSIQLKLAAVTGTAALAVTAFASPALATTQNITYDCTQGSPAPLGPISTTVTSTIPAKLVVGQKSKSTVTVVVHLSQTQTGIAQSLGTSVSGTITSKGADALKLTIPNTPIDQTPGATQDVTASGPGTVSSSKTGKVKVSTGTISATLHLSIDAKSTCTMPSDGTQVLGTTTVSKDTTKSKASATDKNGTVTATDKVASKYGTVPTGKVTITLKKGSKKVGTTTGKLNKKGVASVKWKGVTAGGKYSLTAAYKGDKNVKGSSGKASFTVK